MDLSEGLPCYDFVIKANNENEARDLANDIIWLDYPEQMSLQGDNKEETRDIFWCQEITPSELLEIMTIN